MSTEQKTTKQITDNIIAQLESTLGQTIPFMPKFFLRVIARAFAAVFVLLYKFIGFGALQLFVDTASDQPTTINGKVLTPLNMWGELVGVGDPAPAEQAQLELQITILTPGGSLDAGATLVYSPTGVTYMTLNTVPLSQVNEMVQVKAVADQQGGDGAGAIGNLQPGAELAFTNPQPDVARTAVVVSTTVPGVDEEPSDVYRQRIKDDFRGRPQGGAYADYRKWGTEPATVRSIYPYADELQPGQVTVYAEQVTTPENPDGIPTPEVLQQVADYITGAPPDHMADRAPVDARVNVLPITRTMFTARVYDLQDSSGGNGANIQDVQQAITAAIEEYFRARAPFIEGLDFPPKRDMIYTMSVGSVAETVASSFNYTISGVEVHSGALPIPGFYKLDQGEKAKSDTLFVN